MYSMTMKLWPSASPISWILQMKGDRALRPLRLAAQSFAGRGIAFGVGRQHLDRDAPAEHGVLGEKDLAHAAGAEGREDAVASRKGIHVECVGGS